MIERLLDDAKQSEGAVIVGGRHVVYKDSLGLDTVCYGRLLSRGFSQDEAELCLENDIRGALAEAQKHDWFAHLEEVRQDVVTAMLFNLGPKRFDGFQLMQLALEQGRYDEAARQMLASAWAGQVGKRATRYAAIMQSGVWQ